MHGTRDSQASFEITEYGMTGFFHTRLCRNCIGNKYEKGEKDV